MASTRSSRSRVPDGWWKGELETNVTMDAEDLLLREFLGIRTAEQTAGAAKWIRSRQREDGTWANFFGGPADLSTTIEAYVALRLAGDAPDEEHMQRAQHFIYASGGIESSRVFTRIWLAMFNLWPWEELPVMPPELIYVSRHLPLNIYDFACWARQTVVALMVVNAHRPQHHLEFDVDELKTGVPAPRRRPLSTWAGRFQALDVLLHYYERRPIKFHSPHGAPARRALDSSSVKRPTGHGVVFSLPGSTRSSRCVSRATRLITPSCTQESPDSKALPSKTRRADDSKPASLPSGTPLSR